MLNILGFILNPYILSAGIIPSGRIRSSHLSCKLSSLCLLVVLVPKLSDAYWAPNTAELESALQEVKQWKLKRSVNYYKEPTSKGRSHMLDCQWSEIG